MSRHLPDNQALVQAMRALSQAPEWAADSLLRPVLEALVASTLLALDDSGPVALQTDDGESFLALFTDLIELHTFEPDASWISISAEEAIRSVANGEFDGMIINPAGDAFELSNEDVRDFFDIDV